MGEVYAKFGQEIVRALRAGGVGIIPTDTIYGFAASAFKREAVEHIYRMRGRNEKKPMIILIANIRDLNGFGIRLSPGARRTLARFWPGKVSAVLPCARTEFRYLHRGTNSLAFRLPATRALRELVKKTGPLVSTSANKEGARPAKTAREARRVFGTEVDFYVERKRLSGLPSTLVALTPHGFKVLREGAVRLRSPVK